MFESPNQVLSKSSQSTDLVLCTQALNARRLTGISFKAPQVYLYLYPYIFVNPGEEVEKRPLNE